MPKSGIYCPNAVGFPVPPRPVGMVVNFHMLQARRDNWDKCSLKGAQKPAAGALFPGRGDAAATATAATAPSPGGRGKGEPRWGGTKAGKETGEERGGTARGLDGGPSFLTSVVRVGGRAEHLGLVEAAAQGPHPARAAEEGVPAGSQRAQLLHPALLGPAVLEPDLRPGRHQHSGPGCRGDPKSSGPALPT